MKTNIVGTIIFLALTLCLSCSHERKDWQKATELNTVQSFEQFKTKYPKGVYFDTASIKIEELILNEAILKNNIKDYNSFLKKYPASSFAEMVWNKIIELELSEALSSKNILKIIEEINSYKEYRAITNLILTETDSLKIKSRNSINEDFITKILASENNYIAQFIIPPDKAIEYEIGEIFDGFEVIQGEIIGVLSLSARGLIQDKSSDKGCTLQITHPPNELLYALTNILIIGKGVYIKISDNAYLYSSDDEIKLEKILKPNIFKLISGKVYLIKM